MAPAIGIAIPNPVAGKLGLGFQRAASAAQVAEAEELRRRNLELERELGDRKSREAEMRRELERTKERLAAAEEAEERLCAQLGELEAEAIEQASEYNRRIKMLSDRLAEAQRRIEASGGTILAVD
ncbi:protein RESPONSE TO LOW SULFUR 1-like [Phalaenopsis equestris]|uniref:protein RESPONSE TO LOW SULFUR 1-like n=1 Tax=Phalaenopsis equestris TaxID=78828 RepID=UPI0009E60EBC|nr:protein RESPONSE TO LOW SULFUR 1-like [Phalaenopsis equestris]